MQLADGTDFQLGMTIFTREGKPIVTRPDMFQLDTYDYGPELGIRHSIGFIGTKTWIDLREFFGTPNAAIDAAIEYREQLIRGIRQQAKCDVAHLRKEIEELHASKT